MVQDAWSVDNLPAQIFVVQMTDKERLGCECIWLNIDIGTGNFVNEGRLSDVWVATNQKCAGVGIYGRKSRNVLPDLLEVCKRIFLAFHNCCHTVNIML